LSTETTEKIGAEFERRMARHFSLQRLFGCACARMVWDFLPSDARSAVAISERFACGRATQNDLSAAAVRLNDGAVTPAQHALVAAGLASEARYTQWVGSSPRWDPSEAARSAAKALATRAAGPVPADHPWITDWQIDWNTAFHAARAHQAELVRDIFPPPDHAIRALRCDPSWLTDTVQTLARQADDTGEYGVLPILADALQDAGCDNEIMLDRCRAESGIHCRGNWVVDLLLGRE
jgi:hypothetical protein